MGVHGAGYLIVILFISGILLGYADDAINSVLHEQACHQRAWLDTSHGC